MARVFVEFRYRKRSDGRREEEMLCFICATKKAVSADPEKDIIYIETTDCDCLKCSECGNFLKDTITI